MKTLILFLTIIFSAYSFAGARHVRSYVKKNGTIVQPYMRTAPNKTKADNYSTKGNINPYTGKEGSK